MRDRLNDIRSRLNAATPGPWAMGKYGYVHAGSHAPLTPICCPNTFLPQGENDLSNAVLIANAPSDIAFLLDALSKLERENEDLRHRERMIVSHSTSGATTGEGMHVDAISLEVSALRNKIWEQALQKGRDEERERIAGIADYQELICDGPCKGLHSPQPVGTWIRSQSNKEG